MVEIPKKLGSITKGEIIRAIKDNPLFSDDADKLRRILLSDERYSYLFASSLNADERINIIYKSDGFKIVSGLKLYMWVYQKNPLNNKVVCGLWNKAADAGPEKLAKIKAREAKRGKC